MGIFDQMKQMREAFSQLGNIKEKQEELQKRLSQIRVTASAGAGMVEVTASADGTLTNLNINPIMFNADDKKMLEDLILSASNEVQRKAKEAMSHEMKNVLGFNPSDFEGVFNQIQKDGGFPSV
ncbi:DNA-binding protein, YbaB/EbfC family [Leptospira yanagawae serovar Saopaulo str. Sao Paulo = ATCC 700523]|uniref:Nucleoid-associated protein EHQ46_02855 n=2 Tax=Leptospira yanagawae TaxID=293069 RepID=A0ABY2M7P0_9LEPT|nr:DNA-binding protein, YbaB/EbfC family [Leptospira yanagawae serovar Saopaulo str. Sao Paulo = ATCC 700523]TGL24080.1 YbaB/EbfC family nucleoid-associated protein [Leptospira yanagawae]